VALEGQSLPACGGASQPEGGKRRPGLKFQIKFKAQRHKFWILDFDIPLTVGVWNLDLVNLDRKNSG
jgi:hypothetical protein